MPKGIYERHKGQYINRKRTPALRRFLDRVVITDTCWLYTGTIERNGYGRFWLDGNVSAHRFAYETWIGPIPEGLVIDHVAAKGCTNRNCVNPDHLEAVTEAVNIARGEVGAWEREKTHCPKGHAYDFANTYYGQGAYGLKRQCRACRNVRAAKYR